MYFAPNAPVVWVNRMPAGSVTSVKTTGVAPERTTMLAAATLIQHAPCVSHAGGLCRCSWIDWRSLLSSGEARRNGPVIACADSSALNRS